MIKVAVCHAAGPATFEHYSLLLGGNYFANKLLALALKADSKRYFQIQLRL